MKYKLLKNHDINGDIVTQVLENRDIKNVSTYMNLTYDDVLSPFLLDNMNDAVNMLQKHIDERSVIATLVDEDVDGFCSSAIIYSYIKKIGGDDYPINYILHTKTKAHGLTDNNIKLPENLKLLIVPDAGTNDKKQLKELINNGIDVLILDHHELEETYTDTDLNNGVNRVVIVNNQMSNLYTNKELCGAGVVYKFCKAYDEINWNEYADDYLDLVALANISDVMDMRSFETKYLVDIGLSNIKNKLFNGMINAQNYSMNGKVNIHTVQWNITPIINGMVRVGSYEEKELMFKAFIEYDEFFEYNKRATKNKPAEVINESIYDRVPRLCKNAKARQDKLKDKGVDAIVTYINNHPSDDKILMVDTTELLDNGLTGLVAIKIAETFNKPCLLLNKYYNKELDTMVFGGSARNINYSPIDSLKDILNSSSYLNSKGHANASGIIDFKVEDKDKAINEFNEMLKDIIYDATYRVDFKYDIDDIDINVISDLTSLENYIGTGISEPMIYLENIYINKNNLEVIGKSEDTIKFVINDIEYIMFKCKEGNQLYDFIQDAWNEDDNVTFNIIGKAQWNEYEGVKKPQIQIIDVEVTATNLSNDDEDEAW